MLATALECGLHIFLQFVVTVSEFTHVYYNMLVTVFRASSSSVAPYSGEHRSSGSDELKSRLSMLERELLNEQTKRELLESQVTEKPYTNV